MGRDTIKYSIRPRQQRRVKWVLHKNPNYWIIGCVPGRVGEWGACRSGTQPAPDPSDSSCTGTTKPLFCQIRMILWLTSLLNALFRRSNANTLPGQIPHQHATLPRRLPNLTEEG